MPPFDLTPHAHDAGDPGDPGDPGEGHDAHGNGGRPRPPRLSPGARRRAVLMLAVLVPGTLAVGLLTLADDGEAESSALGPTATVGTRDLATTLESSGTLERSSEHTVAYAGALVTGGSPTQPGGSDPTRSDDDTGDGGDSGDGSSDEGTMSFAGTGGTSSTSTSSSTSSSSSSTTTTCPGSSSTSSTSSTTGPPCSSTTSSSTTSSTTSTTRPSTTSTSAPGSNPGGGPGGGGGSPGTGNGTGDGAGDELAGEGATGAGGRLPGGTDGGSPTVETGAGGPDAGNGTGAPGAGDGAGEEEEGEEVSAVLTDVLDVGATANRGTVLYTADGQPVVALVGDLPAWRTLQEGIDDGADVRQLEENLAALGYGTGLEVDESFTSDTAAAVEDWEADLGRTDPDGVVDVGDIVFLTAPGDVLGHEAEVGDTLQPGSPVLTLGTEQRIVVAAVDVTEAGGWTAGSTVELEWADDTTSTGTVFGTGSDVTDGQVDLVVAIDDPAATGDRRTGSEASVTLEDARRDGAVAVPVAALVEHDGGPAVRVARSGGPDEVVAVETGLVADGWVEITAGLDGGEKVRLPG